MPKMFDFYYD